MTIKSEDLVAACSEAAQDAGITIEAELEPLGGAGAPVKPPTYEGGRYQVEQRWWSSDGNGERAETQAVIVDSTASQANRLEAALESVRAEVRLPEVLLDLSHITSLPPHLPKQLSGYLFPHRHADAYLRDALLDGTKFPDTEVGKAVFAATPDNPHALLEWFPQSLLFGFWQSHLGKKRSQAKLARSWTSEIVGYKPAAPDPDETKGYGLKGDPMTLSVSGTVAFADDDTLGQDWTLQVAEDGKKTKRAGKQTEALSNVGHGPVLVGEARTPLSFAAVTQHSTVSFAALRRLHTGDAEADAAARALLVALGLLAHTVAFGRSFSLRSGCELRAVDTQWTWLGNDEDHKLAPFTRSAAVDLFRECVDRAEAAGLPVGSRWAAEPLVLQPNAQVEQAIRATWPLEG